MDCQREHEERDEGEEPVLVEHHRDEEGDRDRVPAHPAEDIRGSAAQQNCIASKARYQGAGRMGVEIGEIGAHQPREERLLHVGNYPLADPGHQYRTAVVAEPFDHGENEGPAREQP